MSTDLELLQGSRKIAALKMDGAKMPLEAFADSGITIKGKQFVSTGMGGGLPRQCGARHVHPPAAD